MKNKKNLLYIFGTIIFFALIALIYCSPVLSGKAIVQPDIINYRGSAEEMLTYQDKTNEHVYWSDAMFGGMPTYQTGAQYDFDLIKGIDKVFRFLPRPADYIFILFGGFFILGITLFKNWKYALTGSIFFAVGAYFFIIIAAGHNAKVHTIAYFAPLVAGIILLYRQKYISGFILTTLFMGLQLQANHIQMTFYLFLVMLIYVIVQFINDFKNKQLPAFFKSSALAVSACIIALGLNASRLLSTYEYSKETTRGKSEMSLLKSNTEGLDHSYITQWSYGKLETLNLFIPNLMGGASVSSEDDLSNYYDKLQTTYQAVGDNEFNQQVFQALASQPRSTYWGDQPGTSGPAYQGAIVVFLFILGIFLIRGKFTTYKWWLLSATILSILLAWGKNFPFLTNLFIDYVPMYDKFRAVSSILVMAELTMPLLAIITLYYFIQEDNTEYKQKMLITVGGIVTAILAILYVGAGTIFSFQSEGDTGLTDQFLSLIGQANPNAIGFWQGMLKELDEALIADRIALFKADTLRTLFFVLVTIGLLFAYNKKYIKNYSIVVLAIGALALADGLIVDKRYLNQDNFITKSIVDNPFPTEMSVRLESEANPNNNVAQIAYKVPMNKALSDLAKQDQAHYRVYNTTQSTFNEAGTSFFVNSIGGYHAAKLGKYQDLIDIYFSGDPRLKKYGIEDESGLINVLNMLNTKYIVHGDIQEPKIEPNPTAFGPAWLVGSIKTVNNANEEILALNDTFLEDEAVLNNKIAQNLPKTFAKDSTAQIQLTSYTPTKLIYQSNSKTDQLAVFSEIYYPHGWKATVDGKEVDIVKANYILRALPLEKGQHEIVFTYEPQIIKTGKTIMVASNAILVIVILGGLFLGFKKCKKEKDNFDSVA
jgi:hypothetical protein